MSSGAWIACCMLNCPAVLRGMLIVAGPPQHHLPDLLLALRLVGPTALAPAPPAGANWEAVAAYVDISQALKKFDPPAEPEAGKGGTEGAPT